MLKECSFEFQDQINTKHVPSRPQNWPVRPRLWITSGRIRIANQSSCGKRIRVIRSFVGNGNSGSSNRNLDTGPSNCSLCRG
jgi:hypothetical protein